MSRLSLDIEHAGMQAARQPWLQIECYQLSPGKRLAQMHSLDVGGQKVVRESQVAAVQKLGITPPDFCTVSCCTPDPGARFSELGMPDNRTIYFMPECTEFDIYVPAGAETSYVSFSQQAFLAGARALNPTAWECAPQQVLSLRTEQHSVLADEVTRWLGLVGTMNTTEGFSGNTPVHSDYLLHSIVQIATATGQDQVSLPRAERARAYHLCRRARLLVDECLSADRVPSVVELCIALDVSERTLQYAFRTYVDMSPLAYLRLCRLNRVRELLLAEDRLTMTVTALAMRFGFFDLERFAIDYKRVFDEFPVETQAQSMIKSGVGGQAAIVQVR